MKNALLAFVIVVATTLGGCGTVGSFVITGLVKEKNDHPMVFSGVQADLGCLRSHPYLLLDLPFSLALDAVLLPYTVPQSVAVGVRHARARGGVVDVSDR